MKTKPKVVIDTNVFIKSWFDNQSHCVEVTDMVDKKRIKLLFSQDTIGELIYIVKKFAIKNMSSEKPRIEILNSVVKLFYDSESINTMSTESPNLNDVYDEMFLKCAIQGKADYLISDDFKSGMHKVKEVKTKIINSEKFIKEYKGSLAM